MLLLAAAFLGASLWLRIDQAEKLAAREKRAKGRLLVDHAMLSLHWTALEKKEEFQPLIASLTENLSNQEYTWEVLRPESPDGLGTPRDEFEQEAMDRFLSTKPSSEDQIEFVDRFIPERSVYQYYQPIRVQQSCMAGCHRVPPGASGSGDSPVDPADNTPPPPAMPDVGDLMAVIGITIVDVPPR